MNSTMWTYFFLVVGILGIVMINIFTNILITNEQNYMILKEATEGAMIDSVDLKAFREGLGYDGVTEATDPESMHCVMGQPGTVRILKEKFVENFTVRFARGASMAKNYHIMINDIDECPPKVSITVSTEQELPFLEFFRVYYNSENDTNIVNKISGILETKRGVDKE